MDVVTQQIVVLLVFAMALLFTNMKAGMTWLKFLTLWGMIACFVGAAYLIVDWMFL
jgi:uncharacterized membrane protein